jgi:DNA primase
MDLLPQKYPAEKEVIRLLLLFGNQRVSVPSKQGEQAEIRVADYVLHEIAQDELEFHHPVYNQIFTELIQRLKEENTSYDRYFTEHPDELVSRTVVDLITSEYDLSKIWKRKENYYETEDMRLKEIVPEAILALKSEKVLQLLKETETELRFAQEQKDEERVQALQIKFMVLNNLKMNLSKGLGDRIIINTL